MAFNAIKAARVAAIEYVATHGFAAFQLRARDCAFPGWREATEDDAAKLCQALNYGTMFAKFKAEGRTPAAKKSSADQINSMASAFWADKNAAEDEPATDGGDVEPDARASIDPATIFAKYNANRGGGARIGRPAKPDEN